MRVIGVVDLLAGLAVHARAGQRERYAPIHTAAGAAMVPGDAVALAGAYIEGLGLEELYVADLDGILGRGTKTNSTPIMRLASLRARIWLDAGVTSVPQAEADLARGASHVVVGLETLPSFDVLEQAPSASTCATASRSGSARGSRAARRPPRSRAARLPPASAPSS
jgi:phosphoribosylformimino-5-aminoimidazole carboxamide ribotide isomerase